MFHKGFGHSSQGSRHCFRCDLPLTDAASLNEGIGPICRKLDNAVLARLIPSNLPEAVNAFKLVDVLNLAPDTVRGFLVLESALTASDAPTREDWREVAKRIEWMLSFAQTYQNTERLKTLVLSLGYVGLVALWNGEAATGKASVLFNAVHPGPDQLTQIPHIGGWRLFVSGPKKKAARFALKKIPGSTFHQATPFVKAGWSVPACQHEAFRLAVIKHYPNFEGLDLAIKAAKESLVLPPGVSVTQIQPLVLITEVEGQLKVKTPYNPDFVTDLKNTIPVYGRKWDPIERVWVVNVGFKAKVSDVVAKHFP